MAAWSKRFPRFGLLAVQIIVGIALVFSGPSCSSGESSGLDGQYINEASKNLLIFDSGTAYIAQLDNDGYSAILGFRINYEIAKVGESKYELLCTHGGVSGVDVGDTLSVEIDGNTCDVISSGGESLFEGRFRVVFSPFEVDLRN